MDSSFCQLVAFAFLFFMTTKIAEYLFNDYILYKDDATHTPHINFLIHICIYLHILGFFWYFSTFLSFRLKLGGKCISLQLILIFFF